MHREMEMIPCSIVRGGTSKGVFLMESDLPQTKTARDRVILAVYGSPDPRQIDGLGGADILTSKCAIIGPPTKPGADVDYTFAQVSFAEAFVDYGGNCGNISSAVGPFAIDKGLVRPVEPITTVRIHLTNTGRILVAEVPVVDGKAAVYGDYSIDGVPGTGARITLDWSDVVGGTTGKLLPTGNVVDTIKAGGKSYEVSVVDAGNVNIFIRASDLGLTGTETPNAMDADAGLNETIQEIRGKVCLKVGLVNDWREARYVTPYQPFFNMVSKPVSHTCFNGAHVDAPDVDVVCRNNFMLKMHKAYPITGTTATGAAARIPGSILWQQLDEKGKQTDVLRIGHASGVIPIEVSACHNGGETKITRLGVYRTARLIMDGYVYVRKTVFVDGEGQ